MTLEEAYHRLELRPLDEWQGGGPESMAAMRRMGSSTLMLIEMLLDMDINKRKTRRAPNFMLVAHNAAMAKHLITVARDYNDRLGLSLQMNRVHLHASHGSDHPLQGLRMFSWAIFCDYTVKIHQTGMTPNLWPFDRVRSLRQTDLGWEARDRDDVLLGHLTDSGKTELLDAATCPISVSQPGQSDVSYPPWTRPPLAVSLRAAFQV